MCRVDYGDEEGAWLVEPHWSPADRSYTCCECRRTIEAGEKINQFSWSYDLDENGELRPDAKADYTEQFCAECGAAALWLNEVCSGHLYGKWQIQEDLEEHWDQEWYPIKTISLGRLVLGMSRQWKRRDGSRIPVETIKGWALDGARRAIAAQRSA